MGSHVSKDGVAVEGKAAADPASAKANGQVSVSGEPHGTQRPLAVRVTRTKQLSLRTKQLLASRPSELEW